MKLLFKDEANVGQNFSKVNLSLYSMLLKRGKQKTILALI